MLKIKSKNNIEIECAECKFSEIFNGLEVETGTLSEIAVELEIYLYRKDWEKINGQWICSCRDEIEGENPSSGLLEANK